MEWHLGFGELVGTAALVLSSLTLLLRYLDRRERVRSQRRASVSAQPKGGGSVWIVNDGPADARNVEISIDYAGIREPLPEGAFPIRTLPARSRVEQQVAVARVYSQEEMAEIALTWEDGSKDGREWRSNVRLLP